MSKSIMPKYDEEKAYVALNGINRPGILFGRGQVYGFYCGHPKGITEIVLEDDFHSPQEAIDAIYECDGTVYEFDTIREAMTFFLEHLKEEE